MKVTIKLKKVLEEDYITRSFYLENDSLITAFEEGRAKAIQSITKKMIEESLEKGAYFVKNITVEI